MAVVASRKGGRYSARVRKLVLQRWALIFLLVSRLVIGEFAHAMPMDMSPSHHQMSHVLSEIAGDPAACPQHEGAQQGDTHPSTDDGTTSSESQDCCKSGECECPCLHVPCAAIDATIFTAITVELRHLAEGTDGLMSHRLSGLFRPPA